MERNKIWLSPPRMGGSEQKYIQEAFDSNWIAPAGSNLDSLEQTLEKYLGMHHVAVLNSGTASIHLGLILLGVKSGDVVLCQSMTFSASANPILYQNATPIFIDSEPKTMNLCPIALEKAIVGSIANGILPKVIVAVHLFGIPYQIEAVRAIADKFSIPILEDSAEALGSSYKGQKCGTFGDVAVLSFNGSKIITTSGGGAIITSSLSLKKRAIFLATQAKDKAPHYQHSEIGYNYRMSSICAGIGRGQMEALDQHIVLKRAVHDFYQELFKEIKGVTVFKVPNSNYQATYWLTTILVDPVATNGVSRETLRLALAKENIESRPLWKPLHLQPFFCDYPYYGGDVAETLFNLGLCLPSGCGLTEEELERIKVTILKLFRS